MLIIAFGYYQILLSRGVQCNMKDFPDKHDKHICNARSVESNLLCILFCFLCVVDLCLCIEGKHFEHLADIPPIQHGKFSTFRMAALYASICSHTNPLGVIER